MFLYVILFKYRIPACSLFTHMFSDILTEWKVNTLYKSGLKYILHKFWWSNNVKIILYLIDSRQPKYNIKTSSLIVDK